MKLLKITIMVAMKEYHLTNGNKIKTMIASITRKKKSQRFIARIVSGLKRKKTRDKQQGQFCVNIQPT